jgi:acyl carrier protein
MGQSQRVESPVSGDRLLDRQVKQIMADVLGVSPEAVGEATRQNHIASWDSLNHIRLVLALEQEFQVTFEIDEIESMVSYADIERVIRRKVQPS